MKVEKSSQEMSDVGVSSSPTPQICRLCLAQTTICFSLIRNTEASGMLEALTSLRILSTDEISTIMCLKCRLNLKLAFSIQQNMLKAEQRFRNQLLPAQIKEECDNVVSECEDVENEETLKPSEDEENDATATPTYHCDICGVEKSSKKQLQCHRYNVHRRKKRCTDCDRDIQATMFQEHLKEHEKECDNAEDFKGYTCEICGIVKASQKSLDHHDYNVHQTKKCPECDEDVTLGKFKEHLDEHVGTKYICDVCGSVKSSKRNLRHHMYNVHMSKKCPKCDKDVKLTRFKQHVDSHRRVRVKRDEREKITEEAKTEQAGTETFTCNICACVKPSRYALQHHKFSVHKFRKCPVCDKAIAASCFRLHVIQHSKPEDPKAATAAESQPEDQKAVTVDESQPEDLNATDATYPCDFCGVTCDSRAALKKHKYILHVEGTCPICGKTVKHVNLRRHIERHKNIQTVCHLCGVTMNSQDLTSHMNYNHKQKSFKCPSCDKVYKRKQSLMAHEKREHLKKADFVCDTCGKRFHAHLHLKKHIDGKHLKLRPFVCEFCKVGFSSRFSLVTHRRQHTNETPYKCEFCSEGFRQKVSLKGHLRTKHDVTEKLTCECSTCGKKFGSSAALIAHGRIH